jgi:hypothetical protein
MCIYLNNFKNNSIYLSAISTSIKAKDEYYNNIIPTAWLTAYRRTFSDIPFSSEIFKELDKLLKSSKFPITEDMTASQLSPQMEARYKLVNHLLKYQKGTQILEIASVSLHTD